MTTPLSPDRVVLVGFMGSGKSTVGERLAELLKWSHVDSDVEVERRLNLTVPEVFDQLGEEEFRKTERTVVSEALAKPQVVVSTGGGWAEQQDTIETVPDTAFVVWLEVSAEDALGRIRQSADRPLLQRPDALAFATTLLRRRTKRYALAHRSYDTAYANPRELAEQIRIAVQSSGPANADGSTAGTQTPSKKST